MYIVISISTLQTTKLLLIRLNIQFVRAAARSSDNRFVKQESPCNETSADLLSQKQRTQGAGSRGDMFVMFYDAFKHV